jgi:predicted DNA-binding transcriptional regulator AlpA
MPDRIVTESEELKSITGLTKRVLQKRSEEKKFPRPIALGHRVDGRVSIYGYRMSDLQRWIRQQVREQKATA